MNRLPEDLRGVDTVVLNRCELAALGWREEDFALTFAKLRAAGLQRLIVTLGEGGVRCSDAGQADVQHVIPDFPDQPEQLEVIDVSGAGDAFCAGLCASFLRYPCDALAQHAKRAIKPSLLTVQSAHTVSPIITRGLIRLGLDFNLTLA